MLVCDISQYESIKYLEHQLEKIFEFSNFNNNVYLIANIKNDLNLNDYFNNLTYLSAVSERFNINKVNYINLYEYNVSNDKHYEKFVNNCLIKKEKRTSRININESNDINLQQKHIKSNIIPNNINNKIRKASISSMHLDTVNLKANNSNTDKETQKFSSIIRQERYSAISDPIRDTSASPKRNNNDSCLIL